MFVCCSRLFLAGRLLEGLKINIIQATTDFETWLHKHVTIWEDDLAFKHEQMASGLFMFMRATYYRWAQIWPKTCPESASAPAVLAVGDLHVENFGTWRDSEGRLVWGINDFDEASTLAYTNDLVRLAASACMAINEDHLDLQPDAACKAILDGYSTGIESSGRPFILAETTPWLEELAHQQLSQPVAFWNKLESLPTYKGVIPEPAVALLTELLPAKGLGQRWVRRRAGLGSLGHQRFVSLAMWCGGMVARESKQLAPSSCSWASHASSPSPIAYKEIIEKAVRCPDPTVSLHEPWIVRRLAPDCHKIPVSSMPKKKFELLFLSAMGAETANIHLGSTEAVLNVRSDLKQRQKQHPEWLSKAAGKMVGELKDDWKDWKKK